MTKRKMTKKALKKISTMSVIFTMAAASTVLASEVNVGDLAVIKGLKALVVLITSIISLVGIGWTAKAGMDFAQAFQDRDMSSMKQSATSVGSGLIMFGIGGLLTYLGVTF